MNDRLDESVKRHVGIAVNNLLHEFRGDTNNDSPMVPLSEGSDISRILKRHSGSGYAIISPCKGKSWYAAKGKSLTDKELEDLNKKRYNSLIEDIKNTPFTYTPVYGGYVENNGTDDRQEVFERSAIVYCHDRDGRQLDFEDLRRFAMTMCGKYDQDEVLVAAPNGKPTYIKADGSVSCSFDGETFNDVTQTYFTDLYSTGSPDPDRRKRRMTFLEAYANPKPQSWSEGYARWHGGEIF